MSKITSILSAEKMNQLKNEFEILKGPTLFSKSFPKDSQINLLESLMETLIQDIDKLDSLKTITELAYHICRYGENNEIKKDALNILALTRESDSVKKDANTQYRLFNMIRHLSEPAEFKSNDFNNYANQEIIPFLSSNFTEIRNRIVFYYIDTKHNPHHNLLNLSDDLKNNEKFLTTILSEMIRLLLEGPKSWTHKITDKPTTISTEDILTKFLNQFVHGKLGLESEFSTHSYRINILEAIRKLDSYKIPKDLKSDEEKIAIHYKEHLNSTTIKAISKYVIHLEKTSSNISTGIPNLIKDALIKELAICSEILSLLKIEKLKKVSSKALESIENSNKHLNSI